MEEINDHEGQSKIVDDCVFILPYVMVNNLIKHRTWELGYIYLKF